MTCVTDFTRIKIPVKINVNSIVCSSKTYICEHVNLLDKEWIIEKVKNDINHERVEDGTEIYKHKLKKGDAFVSNR